jgi:hypothetical protein
MFAYSFCSQAIITYLLRKLATKEYIDDETYGGAKDETKSVYFALRQIHSL